MARERRWQRRGRGDLSRPPGHRPKQVGVGRWDGHDASDQLERRGDDEDEVRMRSWSSGKCPASSALNVVPPLTTIVLTPTCSGRCGCGLLRSYPSRLASPLPLLASSSSFLMCRPRLRTSTISGPSSYRPHRSRRPTYLHALMFCRRNTPTSGLAKETPQGTSVSVPPPIPTLRASPMCTSAPRRDLGANAVSTDKPEDRNKPGVRPRRPPRGSSGGG